ncbi:MAG: hypothetical protein MjAS7_0961 [Metallosphaera javensis (ex Sakai et al. 2022)]|nr:MAG: hypothetical protein MjAS7_0961 [Metallosphaera javensis (ex Sakai et al. 2022)]
MLRTRDDELRRVPRTRRKGFRPRILPEKGERTSEDYGAWRRWSWRGCPQARSRQS